MAKNSKTHRSRFALGIVLAVIILVVVGGAPIIPEGNINDDCRNF